jgi:hypothetical protein
MCIAISRISPRRQFRRISPVAGGSRERPMMRQFYRSHYGRSERAGDKAPRWVNPGSRLFTVF